MIGTGTINVPGMVEITSGKDKGQILSTERTLITSGCKPRRLPDLEVDGERVMTSRQALEMKKQPKSIVIVGAGAIGAEFAYFLNALAPRSRSSRCSTMSCGRRSRDRSRCPKVFQARRYRLPGIDCRREYQGQR